MVFLDEQHRFFDRRSRALERIIPHMHEVSRFFGMVVRMEHEEDVAPFVHVHYEASKGIAYYAKVSISPPSVIEGWLSEICWDHMKEWVSLRDRELLEAWDMLRGGSPVSPIEELR